jgi:hypothetical protein
MTAFAFSHPWLRIFGKFRLGGWALGTSDRGGQDKARFLAAGTSFLSVCLHIGLQPIGFDAARCGDGASDAISFVFNGLSAVARNVRGRRDRTAYADATIYTLLCDGLGSRLPDMFRLPIVVSWRATKTTFVSVPARSAIAAAGKKPRAESVRRVDARPASSVRSIGRSGALAATRTGTLAPGREADASMRGAVALQRR